VSGAISFFSKKYVFGISEKPFVYWKGFSVRGFPAGSTGYIGNGESIGACIQIREKGSLIDQGTISLTFPLSYVKRGSHIYALRKVMDGLCLPKLIGNR